jgi:Fur family peroxide stress response transcriptional regulator
VEYVINTDEHPSAEHIYEVIKKEYPMVSLSTVYKTLELLRKKRLINEIEVNGQSRFDANTDEHINLVCMNCGKINDIDEDSIKAIQSRAEKKSKYMIVRSSFDLYGYCSSCKPKLEK